MELVLQNKQKREISINIVKMSDIQYWEDTLVEDISTIRSLLKNLPSNDLDKSAALDAIERKLKSAKGIKKSFKMECRLVADHVFKRKYELSLQQRDEEVTQLESDLKALQDEHKRNELFLNADGEEGAGDGEDMGDKLVGDMHNIQDKTQSSLDNTKNLIEASKDVGLSTLEELHRQREQLQQIDEDVDRLEDNLKRADKLLTHFGKRMATDRFIQCFALVNMLLLVGLIVYITVKKGSLPGIDDGAPPSPANARRALRALGHF